MDVCFLLFSCGPTNGGEMVSRRKILSRSRDDLHMEAPPDEEDVWYQKEKLFKVQPNKDNFDFNPLSVMCHALVLEQVLCRLPLPSVIGDCIRLTGTRLSSGPFLK